MAGSPELTIQRNHWYLKFGIVVGSAILLLIVGAIISDGRTRQICLWLLAFAIVGCVVVTWVYPQPRKVKPRPVVFWMRHFNASLTEIRRVQRFVEFTLCDCCLVVLASQTIQTDFETRILRNWRVHVSVFVAIAVVTWFGSSNEGAAVLGGFMSLMWVVMSWWTRIKARPVGVTAASEKLFREAIDAIRARRSERRTVLFQCPIDSPVWESLVDDLVPLMDAAVVSNRDIRWAADARERWAAGGPRPGLIKELDQIALDLGPGKTVLLVDEGDQPALASGEMRVCTMPSKLPWLPLAEPSLRFSVALQSAIASPRIRSGASSTALAERFWLARDDRRRPWWQRAGILLLLPVVLVLGTVLALIGSLMFEEVARNLSDVRANPSLWMQPIYVGDDFWRGGWVILLLASSLALVFWLWRRRPLSREWFGEYLVGLGSCLLVAGFNFNRSMAPRDVLGVANLIIAGMCVMSVMTLRRVKPESVSGTVLRAVVLWAFVFAGVLVPLGFGIGLLRADVSALAVRFIHPISYWSMAGAALVVAWITWKDRG